MKNILYISPSSSPFDVGYGGAQRSNLLLRACTQVGEVDVICFDDVPEDANLYGARLIYAHPVPDEVVHMSRFKKIVRLFSAWKIENHYPIQRKKEQIVDGFVNKKHYDFIVTRYIPWAVDTGLLKYSDRLVVDVDDSPVEKAWNEVRLAKTIRNKIYMSFYTLMTEIAIRRFLNQISVSFFSNQRQAIRYKSLYLPNIPFHKIVEEQISTSNIKRGRILFVGDLEYGPNYSGVDRFLSSVYPRLKKGMEVHIVGRHLDDKLKYKWMLIKGVSVLGYVDDIVREYSEAEVVAIPIYYGAGTCIKVLEAMQMHRVVVTTSVGARGYEQFIKPNQDYLLARSDDEFVAHINNISGNVELQQHITSHASNVINQNFSYETFNRVVKNALV